MRKSIAAGAAVLAAVLPVSSIDAAAPAKVKSPWQLFGGTKATVGYALLGPTWAANRVWVIPQWGDGGTLASARVSGRRLGSFAAQRLSAGDVNGAVPTGVSFADGRLIVRTGENAATAPLLPDGRLGDRKVVPDDLLARAREAVPRIDTVGIQSGVRVGDRIVWALQGGETVGLGAKDYQLVCCSPSGAAVDLTRFIDQRTGVFLAQIAIDTRGRIWLAWLDHRDYPHALRGSPRIFELDRSSLAPRTAPLAAPGVVADRLKLACAGSCRLVAQTAAGDIVSWAPGEPRPTRVAGGWRPAKCVGVSPAWLLAATYRSGHLVVGYQGARGETQYCDATVRDKIRVVRGNARGAGADEVTAIPVANSWPPQNPTSSISGPVVYGTFTPSGLFAVEWFQYNATPTARSPVVGAFMPLGP
jgi:hypothetical protein